MGELLSNMVQNVTVTVKTATQDGQAKRAEAAMED
jgi:hypothetical protein